MPRACRVCSHPDRGSIDDALSLGVSLRTLSVRYRLSKSSLTRHRQNHIELEPNRLPGGGPVAQESNNCLAAPLSLTDLMQLHSHVLRALRLEPGDDDFHKSGYLLTSLSAVYLRLIEKADFEKRLERLERLYEEDGPWR